MELHEQKDLSQYVIDSFDQEVDVIEGHFFRKTGVVAFQGHCVCGKVYFLNAMEYVSSGDGGPEPYDIPDLQFCFPFFGDPLSHDQAISWD